MVVELVSSLGGDYKAPLVLVSDLQILLSAYPSPLQRPAENQDKKNGAFCAHHYALRIGVRERCHPRAATRPCLCGSSPSVSSCPRPLSDVSSLCAPSPLCLHVPCWHQALPSAALGPSPFFLERSSSIDTSCASANLLRSQQTPATPVVKDRDTFLTNGRVLLCIYGTCTATDMVKRIYSTII